MAAITTNTTGAWSNTSAWTGGIVPVEGDTVTIRNLHTITIDQNVTVGADTATPAINIALGGKLQVLSTVAGDYTLALKGTMDIYGTFEVGTAANPIPSTRTFTLKLNYSATPADHKYWIKVWGQTQPGVIRMHGASRAYDRCHLNANIAATPTGNTLTTDVSTGWVTGDEIAVAGTSQTPGDRFARTLTADASGTTLTLDSNPPTTTYGYDGTAGSYPAEIVLLTRNIVVMPYTYSATNLATNMTSGIRSDNNIIGTFDFSWVQFKGLGAVGSGLTTQAAICIAPTIQFFGTATIDRCSFSYSEGDRLIYCITGYSPLYGAGSLSVTNCVAYWGSAVGANPQLGFINQSSPFDDRPTVVWTGNWTIGGGCFGCITGGNSAKISFPSTTALSGGWTITNNIAANASVDGFALVWRPGILFEDNFAHGCYDATTPPSGFVTASTSGNYGIRMARCNARRCSRGFHFYASAFVYRGRWIDCKSSGCSATVWSSTFALHGYDLRVIDFVVEADPVFTTPQFNAINQCYADMTFVNLVLATGAITSSVQRFSGNHYVNPTLNGTTFLAADYYTQIANYPINLTTVQMYDGTVGDNRAYNNHGTRSADTTIYRTTSPSERLAPRLAGGALESSVCLKMGLSGTQTISVYIRKSVAGDGAAYNGMEPKLLILASPLGGIKQPIVLDTATLAAGNWERLTATVPALDHVTMLEFIVLVNGTAGWVNISDWT